MNLPTNSTILILSHFAKRAEAGGGPPQDIRDYLLSKVKRIYYIEHPFPYASDHRSSLTIYEDGKVKNRIFTPTVLGPAFFFYMTDILLTWFFLLRIGKKIDVCIALDNLNTFTVLPFKKLGLIKKLVFYTIDYMPERFENVTLNTIYHLIDRLACYHADAIWILSERMIKARKQNHVDIEKCAPNILLPMGARLSEIALLPTEQINRHDIVYVGYLSEKQGVQLVLESLPKVISKIPDVKFIIIGQGEYEASLRKLTQRLHIGNHVKFKGFIKNYTDVHAILCRSAIGIAPYPPTLNNYTYYTDPGKPKLYLGCGLPVIITSVPAISRIIQRAHAGLCIDYASDSLAKALIAMLSNYTKYCEYRENAIRLSKRYDSFNLIRKAFAKIK